MTSRSAETAGADAAHRVGPGEVVLRVVRAIGPQNLGLLAGLTILLFVIRTQTDRIFIPTNLIDIGVAVSILGILSVAQMVVIISGGLDISNSSTATLSGVVAAIVLTHGTATPLALAAGVAVGLAGGAINGAIIVRLRINPIITTLATFGAYAGIAEIIANGLDVDVTNHFLDVVATEKFVGLPWPLVIFLAFSLLTYLMLRFTVIGRHVYALGSNEAAARNTGINLALYKLGIYTFSGAAGALAGLLAVARASVATPTGDATTGLTAITAALLGGAALNGGSGSVPGAILGVLILGVLDNGLILTGVEPFYSQLAVGILLVLAVALQQARIADRLAVRTRAGAGG